MLAMNMEMRKLIWIVLFTMHCIGLEPSIGQKPDKEARVPEEHAKAVRARLVSALEVARAKGVSDVNDQLIDYLKSAVVVADDDGVIRWGDHSDIEDLQTSGRVPEYLKSKAGKGQGLIRIKIVPGRTVITLIRFSYDDKGKVLLCDGVSTMTRKTVRQ